MTQVFPSPPVGEGEGEGGHAVSIPALILPVKGEDNTG